MVQQPVHRMGPRLAQRVKAHESAGTQLWFEPLPLSEHRRADTQHLDTRQPGMSSIGTGIPSSYNELDPRLSALFSFQSVVPLSALSTPLALPNIPDLRSL